MHKPKITPLIINITKDSLDFCSPSLSTPLVFKFQPTFISEMEIINKDELKTRLLAFFGENKIHSSQVILVLSETMYYQKDYLVTSPPLQEEIQKYIDIVPFSAVSYKLFRIPNGFRLIVLNRDFYENFKQVFENMGFPVASVVPGFVLNSAGVPANFSPESCRIIYKKIDAITLNSFGGSQNLKNMEGSKPRKFIETHKISVVIIFVAVLLFCGILLYVNDRNQKFAASTRAVNNPVVAKPKKPAPTPTATPSASLLLGLNKLKVQILNGSGVPGLSASVEAEFRTAGFVEIQTGNYPRTSVTEVTFSPGVSQQVKTLVMDLLKSLFRNPTQKVSQSTQYDISVTTGKTAP